MLRCATTLTAMVFGACSAPGPTPTEFAAQRLDTPQIDSATRTRLQQQTEAALVALRAGRHEAARRLAEAVLVIDPRAGRARGVLGRAILADALRTAPPTLALLQRAEGELLLARRTAPADPEVRLFHAQFLEADGQLSLAASVLDELVAAHPEHVQGLRAASRLRYELGEERAAMPLLERLLQLTPGDAVAAYRFAHCKLRLAEALARRDVADTVPVAESNPRSGFLAAAAAFRRHRELAPEQIDGHLGEAHARYRAALLLDKTKAGDRRRREFAEVRKILIGAAAVDSRSPAPAHGRAVILEELGERDAARAAYEEALGLDGDYVPSLLNMVRLLDVAGDAAGALKYAKRALRQSLAAGERRRLTDYVSGK